MYVLTSYQQLHYTRMLDYNGTIFSLKIFNLMVISLHQQESRYFHSVQSAKPKRSTIVQLPKSSSCGNMARMCSLVCTRQFNNFHCGSLFSKRMVIHYGNYKVYRVRCCWCRTQSVFVCECILVSCWNTDATRL